MDRRKFIKIAAGSIGSLNFVPLWSENKTESSDQRSSSDQTRKRLREMGIAIGNMEPGPYNAITDIEHIKVGHSTIIQEEGPHAIRTGVTAILPNNGHIAEENFFASYFSLNGWGEMTGVAAIEETGRLKTPVFLTGTYNVGIVYSAAMEYLLSSGLDPRYGAQIPSPVIAECFDDFLSDSKKRMISKPDVFKAIHSARSGEVEEGAVGGGTGTVSFGFKGGIGTSSRIVSRDDMQYTVGVLVQANTASRDQLRIDGVPVGKEIVGYEIQERKSKSIILIAATDAPLLPYQLKKIAKRVAMGLSRTGAISHTESGDIILAFSTGNRLRKESSAPFSSVSAVNDFWISPLYQGTIEATQEAVLNALTSAPTIIGKEGNTTFGLPLDQVQEIMKKYKRIKDS